MAKIILVFVLMVAMASAQPVETSSGVSQSNQLWNWGQALFEGLLDAAKIVLGDCRDETSK